MIPLKEYFLYEDEDKFVNIEYKTTKEDDGVKIADPVYKNGMKDINYNTDDEEDDFDIRDTDNLKGGVDAALVGEVRLYSETSPIFNERKRKIVEAFKKRLKSEEVNANRIKYTKIFEYYINHLLKDYKKNVDENFKINISSRDELERQLSDDFVLLIRGKNVI